ncbi:MAG: VCBS repeat-containing protein, partial [Leptospiraceae bacterium]|nr:VCBS repeat-containing protein [Leptospiraceae bacterium]
NNASYYYLGSASGFGSQNPILSVAATSDNCSSLAVGDFNNDGYGDVAISDHNSNGKIYIHYGNATGLNITPAQTISDSGSNLGLALAGGDINGDGKTDLAALTSTNVNYVRSYLSNGNTLEPSSIIGNIHNSSIVLGDFNGDGKADLAASNIIFSGNSGQVSIYLSNGSALNTATTQNIKGETGYYFAKNLSVGDVNQDGIMDLIAGNPENASKGAAYIFHGCVNTGICGGTGDAIAIANTKITVSGGANALFGSTTRVIDINRDGFPDLLVGSSGLNNQKGGLYIFEGNSSGIPITPTRIIAGEIASDGKLGASLY